MRPINAGRRGERGTQIAEFALVLPLLVFLVLVVTEGAAFVRVHQIVNNAAREGARIASLPENDPATYGTGAIVNAVNYYAFCNGVDLTGNNGNGLAACAGSVPPMKTCAQPGVTVAPQAVVDAGGITTDLYKVTVRCGYTLTYLPKLQWVNVPNTINLTGSAAFRKLYATP